MRSLALSFQIISMCLNAAALSFAGCCLFVCNSLLIGFFVFVFLNFSKQLKEKNNENNIEFFRNSIIFSICIGL